MADSKADSQADSQDDGAYARNTFELLIADKSKYKNELVTACYCLLLPQK